MPSEEFIEAVIQMDMKEKLLSKIRVWLRTKKLWDECMTDIDEKQLRDKHEL